MVSSSPGGAGTLSFDFTLVVFFISSLVSFFTLSMRLPTINLMIIFNGVLTIEMFNIIVSFKCNVALARLVDYKWLKNAI